MVAGGKRKKEGIDRTSMRLATDLYDWSDSYAKANGYSSAAEVVAHAVRELRDRENARRDRDEAQRVRRELFDAWVESGKKWPPPPGLMTAVEKAQA